MKLKKCGMKSKKSLKKRAVNLLIKYDITNSGTVIHHCDRRQKIDT